MAACDQQGEVVRHPTSARQIELVPVPRPCGLLRPHGLHDLRERPRRDNHQGHGSDRLRVRELDRQRPRHHLLRHHLPRERRRRHDGPAARSNDVGGVIQHRHPRDRRLG
ncbi:hypothetical protein ACFPRL_30560 [Pseudoclavibacter helvolus]